MDPAREIAERQRLTMFNQAILTPWRDSEGKLKESGLRVVQFLTVLRVNQNLGVREGVADQLMIGQVIEVAVRQPKADRDPTGARGPAAAAARRCGPGHRTARTGVWIRRRSDSSSCRRCRPWPRQSSCRDCKRAAWPAARVRQFVIKRRAGIAVRAGPSGSRGRRRSFRATPFPAAWRRSSRANQPPA